MSDNKIGFVIAGQPKSGTSALAKFLSEHPQISFSIPKEPGYFATDHIKESYDFHGKHKYFKVHTKKQLMSLFNPNEDTALLGEGTTNYLYSKVAAKNLSIHNPNMKIIIMLRNPVHFIHSLHMQYCNDGTEDIFDFEKALNLESERKKGKKIPQQTRCPSFVYYSERYRYAEHINRFYKYFSKENIMIISNEKFTKNNESTYKEVLSFLELDNNFLPEFNVIHGSKTPRIKLIHKIINNAGLKSYSYNFLGPYYYHKLHKKLSKLLLKKQSREPLKQDLYERLKHDTRPEVEKLSKLLNEDFVSYWGYND